PPPRSMFAHPRHVRAVRRDPSASGENRAASESNPSGHRRHGMPTYGGRSPPTRWCPDRRYQSCDRAPTASSGHDVLPWQPEPEIPTMSDTRLIDLETRITYQDD